MTKKMGWFERSAFVFYSDRRWSFADQLVLPFLHAMPVKIKNETTLQ
jgi:hypothetical protein